MEDQARTHDYSIGCVVETCPPDAVWI